MHAATAAVGSGALLLVDFTTLSTGAVGTLPGGLSFSRASSATVRTDASTVVISGIANDVPRAGRADSGAVGLIIEPTRTNYVPQNRARTTSWNVGSGTTNTQDQTGVDGTSNIAWRNIVNSSGFSHFGSLTGLTNGATYTMSLWVNGNGSTLWNASAPSMKAMGGTTSVSYAFQQTTGTNTGTSNNFIPEDGRNITGGLTAGARDAVTDLLQFEPGAWASEAILTTTATARAGERLYYSSGSNLVSVGRLGFYVKTQIKHSPANADATMRLWTSGTDYCEIATSGVLTVSIGGVTNTTNALSWAANDVVEFWVSAGGSVATVVKYRVNSGSTNTQTITGSALGTLTVGGALDLLCNSTSNQAGQRVQKMGFYSKGSSPAWAA